MRRWIASWSVAWAACSAPAADQSPRDLGEPSDASAPSDASSSRDAATSDAGAVALIHSALWEPAAASDDPFHATEAPDAGCSPSSYGEESLGGPLGFFVRTAGCAYLTVGQALREPVRAGDRVVLELYHFPLTSPEPATAHLALQIADVRLWEREFDIPSEAAQLEEEWVATRDLARGAPVYFHVHNHGINEYVLLGLRNLGRAPATR